MANFPLIYIAGHTGMVGSSIVRHLLAHGHPQSRLLTRTHAELDLLNQESVKEFFSFNQPHEVYLAAAFVGGIHANNTYPATFLYNNLMIQSNVMNAAFESGVKKLLFLGSSCIYPRETQQPISEEALLTSPLEPTNEAYAIAKIAGIKLCESINRQYGPSHGIDYRCIMPTNLYGPGDNYHPTNSHVIPGLIRRFHEAKISGASTVSLWGTGSPRREFLFVDDLAAASVFVMKLPADVYTQQIEPQRCHLNVGYGTDIKIIELAQHVVETVGYEGTIEMDLSMPDGTPQKLLDSRRLHKLGWRPKVDLITGLKIAYNDFLENFA
jgi:GDP-L-fucose synthase